MPAETPDEVWSLLVRAVIDSRSDWRRAVVERTGLPFSRLRVLKRLERYGPLTLKELAEKIADFLPATAGGLRIAGRPDQSVQKIALCTGAGDSLFGDARASGADVYITADLRHHPASEAREQALISSGTPALIDCSHYASEWLWMDRAARLITEKLEERGFTIDTYVSILNTDPWDFTVSTGQVAGSASTR